MYKLSEKGERIQEMFGSIAPRYDLLNRLLSCGIDRQWRRFAVRRIGATEGPVLDVATGTGDVALEIASQTPPAVRIIGIDFCKEMVDLGLKKVEASAYAGRVTMQVAPCEAIPFSDNTFGAATIAFGIRNVVDRLQGLKEIFRVLNPGGRIVVLEFSTPTSPVFRSIYLFYFLKVLPAIGGIFSRQSAYRYLPDSVLEFPSREQFKNLLATAGFCNLRHHDLTFGIATVYTGDKPQ